MVSGQMSLDTVSLIELKLDFTQRWIVDDNWTYTGDISPFLKSDTFRNSKKTILVFYGIDTIANIVCVMRFDTLV